MTETQIKALVYQGIELDREIALLDEKLKTIKNTLVAAAKLDEDNQVKTENGGWSWTARDSTGNIARVTVPARGLKANLDLKGKVTTKVLTVVPQGLWEQLFTLTAHYELVDNFRTRAAALLEKPTYTKLLKLVTSSPKTTVSFETKPAEAA